MVLHPQQVLETGLGVALGAGLLAGGYAYAAMWPASRIFGQALIAPKRAKELALTFDDGPNPRWTPLLLDTLAEHTVSATFFLIGKYAARQPALVRRIHQAGHLIGNHTWTHPNLAITGSRQTCAELQNTSNELEQITGSAVRYFRPPFGGRRPATLRIARELGMTPVLWNAISPDWQATKAEQVVQPLSNLVEKNDRRDRATNIVLHDGGHLTLEANRAASVEAAGELIRKFSPNHRFVTLEAWT